MTQHLRVFCLVPAAEPTDPLWLGAPVPGEVIVRARSPADARIVASEAELDFTDVDAKPSHGISTRFASVFRDEKLYSVEEVGDTVYSTDGPREILSGNFDPVVIKYHSK
jgi:hypothetical protein